MKKRSVYAFALSAIFLWSTAGTAFKLALKGMDFIQLLFIASSVAWLILFLFVWIRGRARELFNQKAKDYLQSAMNGFLNPFLFYMVLLKAYSLLPAQIAQPLNYTWPVMLVLLSVPFLKQKLRWIDLAAILISFSGVLVISSQGQNPFRSPINEPFGIFLAIGSSVIWASFWIINVRDKRPEIIKLTLNFFFGSIFTLIALLIGPGLPDLSTHWIPAVYVGLTEMAIAFVCWLIALENTQSNAAISNLVFIAPFLALFLIHLILGERIYWTTPAGLVFLISGILLQQLTKRNGTQTAI
jgi:drug/metabolite transporter (DMT)-like permease